MTDSLDKLGLSIKQLLEDIQKNLFEKALSYQKSKTVEVSNFDEFIKKIDEGNFVIAHYDGSIETEKKIKDLSKATTRCIPFDLEQTIGKCILTGVDCNTRIIFGKSY